MASARIQFLSPATGYIELTEDIIVPLSFGLGDIRDISKRAGAFSKSIVVPGTKQNKDILSHLYDLNIVTGVFDVNKIQKAIIIDEAGSIVFNNGIVQLIDVNKVNNTFTNEEEISFTLLVKDTTGDFFTSMGNKELRKTKEFPGLDFSEFGHRFDQVNVVDSWDNTYVDGYKYLMPYIDPIGEATDNVFHLTEFRPAIYARQYWDKIFASNGYSYTWPSQDSTDIQFSKLVIPYNGDVPKLSQTSIDYQTVEASASTASTFILKGTIPQTITNIVTTYSSAQFIADVELKDNQFSYDPTTGEFTSSYDAQTPGGIIFTYDIDFDIIIENPNGFNVRNENTVVGNPLIIELFSKIINQTTGSESYSLIDNLGIVTDNTIFLPGDTIIHSNSLVSTNLTPNVNAFNILTTDIAIKTPSTQGYWRNAGGSLINNIKYKVRINNIKLSIAPATNTQAGYGAQIDMNQFVPEKIKQADFIKSICNMFNLFIIPDDDNATNLIIKSRNEYYDEGIVFDATSILNKDREQTIEFLPDVTAKRITLTYKQDTDVTNKGYFDNVGEIYGQLQYQFDSEYVKNNETKELIFSPTPSLNTGFGANLPYLSGAAPKSNLRILYDGGMLDCEPYQINEVGLIYSSPFTQYPFMGHFDRPVSPTYDLNYGQCDYYFYDNFNYITSNNLYNKFWKRTLDTMNDGKLVTAYFDLDSANIGQFKLNTKIYLKQYNKYFVINKIIDFDINSKKPTKIELITYDENIKLRRGKGPKVPIKNPIKVPNGATILNPIKQKAKDRFINLNTDLTGLADIKGFNNFVTKLGTNAVIVGSSNYINAANAIVYGTNEAVELPNTNINGPTNQAPSPTSSTLEDVLINGNTTGANDISVNTGQVIKDTTGNSTLSLETGSGTIKSVNGTDNSSLIVEPTKISERFVNNTTFTTLTEKIGSSLQTTTAAPTIANTFVPTIRKVYQVEAIVRGIRTNWATACTFRILASFRVSALGVVTEIGKQFIVENNEFTTATAVLSTDGTNILVTITGEAATTINWSSTLISNIG
jgi:hypothetical protein